MAATDRVRVGRTDVEVTKLGLGTAPLAGLFSAVGDETAAATVAGAVRRGLGFVDTAPHYGAGLAETRLGAALRSVDRARVTVSTKVGRLLVPGAHDAWAEPNGLVSAFDFSYEAAMRSHAESLRRLGLDRVDVALIHDPDDHYEMAMAGSYRALLELRSAGRVGAIGAGMNQSAMLTRMAEAGDFDVFLLAGRYTLLDHSGAADLLPLCRRRRIAVIAGGVYNSGILADPRPGATYNYAPASEALLGKALAIKAVCDRHDVPLRAAALQFTAAHPAITCVLVGMRSPDEVDDAVAMFEHPVPGQLWRDLKSAGLLPDEVPTP